MRITSGKWKGYPLRYPTDLSFRPTQEKVRSAIYDRFQADVQGADMLDLFCGTGANAYEALSRGAQSVTLVDIDLRYAATNRDEILGRLSEDDRSVVGQTIHLVRSSVDKFLKAPRASYDLVMIDPPWDKPKWYAITLGMIAGSGILRPSGYLIVEYPRRIKLAVPSGLELVKTVSYSNTIVSVIQHASHLSG